MWWGHLLDASIYGVVTVDIVLHLYIWYIAYLILRKHEYVFTLNYHGVINIMYAVMAVSLFLSLYHLYLLVLWLEDVGLYRAEISGKEYLLAWMLNHAGYAFMGVLTHRGMLLLLNSGFLDRRKQGKTVEEGRRHDD